ncbi:MAG: NADH-quinone oxidoreductase subunit D [Deltaproteobacteria bacterium]|nr:NADH-quinone oxidoreductase subunit D [Deltaproteobacteria bacterium]
MTPAEVAVRLRTRFGDGAVVAVQDTLLDPTLELAPERLHEAALFLRDEDDLCFDFLRSLAGVDRKDALEVVYHLLSIPRRHGVALRVKTGRDAPRVASVADVWPTAEWHERETFDLFGIVFDGHPDLRRLFLPDDWVGYPLRKDYTPPAEYHGIVGTREGSAPVTRAQVAGRPQVQAAMHGAKAEELPGFMRVNMGPHHPATHGVINFLLETDGEIIRKASPDVGYLHRGIEKLAESNLYIGTMPYTDRVDYLGAIFANHSWALAVEKLLGLAVPPRGEYCRVIASELNRIASHLIATGALAMDVGAFTPFTHWIREREKINDIMERICGARLTYNYLRFGGVARDIKPDVVDTIRLWLDHFEPILREFNRLISDNEIFVRRLADVATISAADAVGFGLVGPNLRASGVDFDLRRDAPYSVYPDLEFDVIVGKGFRGVVGDCYDRYWCRMLEMVESMKLLRQACDKLPEGEFWAKPKVVKPAANEVYAAVESARGELGAYVIADGTDKPYRAKFRTGSYTGLSIIQHQSPGLMLADLVALIGSLDVVAPEVDR